MPDVKGPVVLGSRPGFTVHYPIAKVILVQEMKKIGARPHPDAPCASGHIK